IGLLAVAVGVPVLTWFRSGERAGWGVWVVVLVTSMVAAQCGRNLLRVARSGIGPRWIERDSL
ncbi:MAG: hypothetical protein ABIS07_14845, partial [Dokdonella sp.]